MANSFQERYVTAAARLLGALPRDCRLGKRSISTAEKRLGIRAPLALREYYLGIGKLRVLNEAHNRLLAPEDWFLHEGKLVFLAENQEVVYWGVEALESFSEDPPIFQGVNHEEQPLEWYPEHDRCSEFLLVMLHWQAVCGGLEWTGMADVEQETEAYFEGHWERVGRVAGISAFQREGEVACILSEGELLQVYVGARSEARYETIARELEAAGVDLEML